MVARRTSAARGPTDRILENGQRLETLRTEVGRGAPALRNSADQRLLLDANASRPLLVPTNSEGEDMGVSLKFSPDNQFTGGVLEVRNSRDDGYADLNARFAGVEYVNVGTNNARIYTNGEADFAAGKINFFDDGTVDTSGQIHTSFEIRADQGIRAEGGLSTGGAFSASLEMITQFNYGVASGAYDGSILWDANGALSVCTRNRTGFRGVYATNFAVVAPSWRRLKRDQQTTEEYLGQSALDVVRGLEFAAWRYDPEKVSDLDTEEVHYSAMLDEVPEPLIQAPHMPPVVGGEGPTPPPDPDKASYDRDKMLTLALAAVQDLATQNAELLDRLRALEEARTPSTNP